MPLSTLSLLCLQIFVKVLCVGLFMVPLFRGEVLVSRWLESVCERVRASVSLSLASVLSSPRVLEGELAELYWIVLRDSLVHSSLYLCYCGWH